MTLRSEQEVCSLSMNGHQGKKITIITMKFKEILSDFRWDQEIYAIFLVQVIAYRQEQAG